MALGIRIPIQAQDKFSSPLKNASGAFTAFGKNQTKTFARATRSASTLKNTIAKLAAGYIGLRGAQAAVRGIRNLIEEQTTLGDEVGKTSRALGISAEALQVLQFASEREGVELVKLTKGMQNFEKAVGELKGGGGTLLTELNRLNDQGFKESLIATGSLEERFALVSEKLSTMTDTSKRAALANAAFGGAGKNLIKLFDEGSISLEEYSTRLQELGGIMSDEQIAASEQYRDRLTDLKLAFTGVKNNIVGQLLPAFTSIVQKVQDNIVANNGYKSTIQNVKVAAVVAFGNIKDIVNVASGAIQRLRDNWDTLRPVVLAAVAAIAAYKAAMLTSNIITGIATIKTTFLAAAITAKTAVLKIATIAQGAFNAIVSLNPIALIITGAIVAIGLLVVAIRAIVKNWDAIIAAMKGAWQSFAGFITGVFDKVVGGIMAYVATIAEVVLRIAKVAGGALGFDTAGIDNLLSKTQELRDNGIEKIKGESKIINESVSNNRSSLDITFGNAPDNMRTQITGGGVIKDINYGTPATHSRSFY